MASNFLKYLSPVGGALLGALFGYLYYRWVGCSTGACPITARPQTSMIWWGLIGLLLGSRFFS